MTDKDLRRLRRQDLLQMLVAQSKEAARLQTELEEEKNERNTLQEGYERLKEKLDAKDALIEKLKGRLNHKDDQIQELQEEMEVLQKDKWKELEENGSASEVLFRLRALFR